METGTIEIYFEDENGVSHNIGAIQKIDFKGKREDDSVYGMAGRIRLNRNELLTKIFIGMAIGPKSQKMPLQVKSGGNSITNLWITEAGYAFHSGDYVIVDYLKFEAECTTFHVKRDFPKNDLISCSFCGQTAKELANKDMGLIAGPAVYICDECINLAYDIIQERKSSTSRLGNAPL